MTRKDLDFIGSMNMCDEISDDAYKKIVCHCVKQEPILDKLQEAIEQEKRLAELSYRRADSYHTDENVYMTQENLCRENAEHHEQIAEWLEELQELKKRNGGIKLPKGHGRLIDASQLLTVTECMEDGTERCYVPYTHIEEAETIIEADKGE